MKKSIFLSTVVSLTLGTIVNAQVSNPSNTSFAFPQFVGYDGTTALGGTAKPLEIRNDFNEPIEMYTNGIQRIIVN
jgi:hypothetical protein